MNCSKCEFAAKIQDTEQTGLRFEETPCAKCVLIEDSSHTMAFDEERHTTESRMQTDAKGDDDNGAAFMPVSVLADSLREILTLPSETLRVLQGRYLGRTYKEIANETGVTPQAAEIKLRRFVDNNQYLRHLLPTRMKKQEARKRLRRSVARRDKGGSGVNNEGGESNTNT